MASKTTNEMAERLRARHLAEEKAVASIATARVSLDRALARRDQVLSELEQEIERCRGDEDLALAVASSLRDEVLIAELAGVDVARVRAAVRRVSPERVREEVESLGTVRPRRRRGARRDGAAAGSGGDEAAPAPDVPGTDGSGGGGASGSAPEFAGRSV